MSTPATIRAALDDLKELLREGVITLPQWRDEVAALVRLEREERRQLADVPPPMPQTPPPPPPMAQTAPQLPTAFTRAVQAKQRALRPTTAKARRPTDAQMRKALREERELRSQRRERARFGWRVRWTGRERADVRMRDCILDVPETHPTAPDPVAFFREITPMTVDRLVRDLGDLGPIKTHLVSSFEVMREAHVPQMDDEGKIDYDQLDDVSDEAHFRSYAQPITDRASAEEFVASTFAKMLEDLERYTQNGSGWRVIRVLRVKMFEDRWRPIRGGNYIPTPKWMVSKSRAAGGCIVNVRNRDANDQACFPRAVVATQLVPQHNKERPSFYDAPERRRLFNFKGLESDVKCCRSSWLKFERQNPGYALTVLDCPAKSTSAESLTPVFTSDRKGCREVVLVLLHDDGVPPRRHFVACRNVDALFRGKHNGEEATCLRCLHTYSGDGAKARLAEHAPHCRGVNGGQHGVQRVVCPEVNEDGSKPVIEFKDYHARLRLPYAAYLDFESSIVPVATRSVNDDTKCRLSRATSKGKGTQRLSKHEPNSFKFLTVGPDGERLADEHCPLYRGPDAAAECLRKLKTTAKHVFETLQACPKHALTREQEREHWAAETCHLCGKGGMTRWVKGSKLAPTDRVRDHCHITGHYRGAAHSSCNLRARTVKELPVFVHNLKGYDAHLLFQGVADVVGDVSVIATNTEKYVSFTIAIHENEEKDSKIIGKLVFKDSAQFLLSSLDKLAKNLSPDDLKHTREFAGRVGVDLDLLKRKGVYPYSWVDGAARFAETALPGREAFHNDLDDDECDPKDYEHAQRVWEAARCQTFGDYHNLYLELDVALLADIFETFRTACMEADGLDPAHYYTLPGFSWASLLRYTGVKLELLTDVDMYIACEEGLRGGVCAVSKRHAKANNPRVAGYDSSKPKTWLRYDDANNLYGWAMSQCLPVRGFLWGEASAWTAQRVTQLADDGKQGAFLCVDLEYPDEIHEAHNDFPLCPERMEVPKEWLSGYQLGLLGDKKYAPCEKLVPNLRNKSQYWVHYRNLKFALRQGLRLTRVHKVLEFEQEAWMEPYIAFNTRMRAAVDTEFEKDLYKLKNNAVFGKTMENLRARRDIQALRVQSRAFTRWVADPSYQARRTIVPNQLVIAERSKKKIVLNKPVYVGVAVLELSKLWMQQFWYDELKPRFGRDISLCYTDTDSLVYQIESEEEPQCRGDTPESLFDTSGYPKHHPLHSTCNKKVLGKFKDECNGVAIAEFVGLRPKLYSLRLDEAEHSAYLEAGGDDELKALVKKAKGTKKSVVKKEILFQNYLDTLQTGRSFTHSQVGFRSEAHQVYTTRITKTSLSALDTKRFICEDGVTSLAYGHKDTRPKPLSDDEFDEIMAGL